MVSTERISSELGFKPQFTFQEGIEKTVAWYQENYLSK
jgi:dTDP-D-glucose 4,6-dehydratase